MNYTSASQWTVWHMQSFYHAIWYVSSICIFLNLVSLSHLQIFLSTRWAILLNLHAEMFRTNTYPTFCVWISQLFAFYKHSAHEFLDVFVASKRKNYTNPKLIFLNMFTTEIASLINFAIGSISYLVWLVEGK